MGVSATASYYIFMKITHMHFLPVLMEDTQEAENSVSHHSLTCVCGAFRSFADSQLGLDQLLLQVDSQSLFQGHPMFNTLDLRGQEHRNSSICVDSSSS